MKVGSLFAGIGGFDLGLERAGFQTAWFCEQDEFCQRVLAKHWPDVPCYPDITELRGQDVEPVEILCGGFPCQDLSYAGQGAGIEGERSGLWSEYARLIGELRPQYVVVENVPALLTRGLGRVLGDLAALGYDAEWDCIPASAVGAPHRRDRIWVVAYPNGKGSQGHGRSVKRAGKQSLAASCAATGTGRLADTQGAGQLRQVELENHRAGSDGAARFDALAGSDVRRWAGYWKVEPNVGRVAYGIPDRVDRLKALGNALVPQIAEWIGCRIQDWEEK